MNSLRQRVGPKHQILVLKCYPRHQKHNPDLKPNSSELSYLLYYVSTRRSKLSKVVDFLDKRVASDVWNVRIGYVPFMSASVGELTRHSNVQVSLQILKALIEKCPRDLPLYAAASLRIFKTILKSLDVTMIEETVPTWAAFCAHQDPAILAADQDYVRQYEEIVQCWADFASKDSPVQTKNAKSLPVRIRYRKAGLSAVKAVAESDALSSETSRQLGIIIPAILENIYAEDGQYLNQLEDLEEERTEIEKEIMLKRRQSTTIVEPLKADAAAASGSIEAADRLAELETGVIALQALKSIFAVVPRTQLLLATSKVLRFMGDRIKPQEHFPASTIIPLQSGSWPCMLFGKICGWAPVQDRHVILVTAVEELLKCPLRDDECERQYVLATISGWLLSSEINFIGLSIMDVLMGLLQHMLALLHSDISAGPQPNQENPSSPDLEKLEFEGVYPHHPTKLQLLIQLEKCIGCLAVHVYYVDQVSDMVAAIFSKLRPPVADGSGTPPDPIGSTTSLVRRHSLDGFSSSSMSKVAALRCVKEILVWANWTKPDGSSTAAPRNPIPVEKWQGTQWLLQDENWDVRISYVDILLIWMRTELKRSDLRVPGEPKRQSSTRERKDTVGRDSLAKRAVSNASQRDKSPPRSTSTILPLLHLAIYDNAHRFSDSKKDILLLHLLLCNLISSLGVNSIQHGLPMISRLQDDIVDTEDLPSKINLASLVYGYLWAVSVYFHFDASATGRDISMEISHRLNTGLWLPSLQVPSIPLEEIVNKSGSNTTPTKGAEAIHLYEGFPSLVNRIAEGYKVSLYSPPSSPPTSPIRKFATPITEATGFFGGPVKSISVSDELPAPVREAMTSNWTRESVIAATSPQDGSRSASLSGTTPATNGSSRAQHLSVGVAGHGAMNGEGLPTSPRRSQYQPHGHLAPSPFRTGTTSRPNSAAQGARDAVYQQSAMRDALLIHPNGAPRSRTSHAGTPFTSSSVRNSVRVEDLKRVLHGAVPPPLSRGLDEETGERDDNESASDDSMVSYEGSEPSLDRPPTAAANANGKPTEEIELKQAMEEPETEDEEDIPPMPSVPEGYVRRPSTSTYASSQPHSPVSTRPTAITINSGGKELPKAKFPPSALTGTSKEESIRSANVRESLRRSISTRDGTASLTPAGTLSNAPVQPSAIGPAEVAAQQDKSPHPLQQHPVRPSVPATIKERPSHSRHGKAPASSSSKHNSSLGSLPPQNSWSAMDLLESIDADSGSAAISPGSGILVSTSAGNGRASRGLKPPY
jgi:protein EFR3